MRLLGDLQRCMRIEVDAPNTKNKGGIPPLFFVCSSYESKIDSFSRKSSTPM